VNRQKRLFLIRIAYWLGIGADVLWAVGLFVPRVFGILTGRSGFNPNWELRSAMAVGGVLMTGWTFLLIWAIRKPIERRFVILLTAFPVVFGLFVVAFADILNGNTFEIWILIKTAILFSFMINSYILAGKMANHLNYRYF
jgi:hypothetical protein